MLLSGWRLKALGRSLESLLRGSVLTRGFKEGARRSYPQMSVLPEIFEFVNLILGGRRLGPVFGVLTKWDVPISHVLFESPLAIRALLSVVRLAGDLFLQIFNLLLHALRIRRLLLFKSFDFL